MPRTLSEADGRKLAFRCKSCGRLHESDHAGESPHPHACSVCGKGVVFLHQTLADEAETLMMQGKTEEAKSVLRKIKSMTPGTKTVLLENWEILADAPPERLKDLGIEQHQVVKHVRWTKPGNAPAREPQHLERAVAEGAATQQAATQKTEAGN